MRMRRRLPAFLVFLLIVSNSSAVIISELMPHPAETGEWIELYNEADSSTDIRDFMVFDQAGSGGTVTRQRLLIPPCGFVILLEDSLNADILNLPTGTSLLIPESLPSLNDDGDLLIILDANGEQQDEVRYSSDQAKYKGRSVERIGITSPGNDPGSWGVCVDRAGHTAGRINSLSPVAGRKVSICAQPNPFSPDGDGIDETTFISFNIPAVESRITVRIFDQAGRKVRCLSSAFPAGCDKPGLEWNGRDDHGRKLALGRYIIMLEALDYRNGRYYSAKCTVILASRL